MLGSALKKAQLPPERIARDKVVLLVPGLTEVEYKGMTISLPTVLGGSDPGSLVFSNAADLQEILNTFTDLGKASKIKIICRKDFDASNILRVFRGQGLDRITTIYLSRENAGLLLSGDFDVKWADDELCLALAMWEELGRVESFRQKLEESITQAARSDP